MEEVAAWPIAKPTTPEAIPITRPGALRHHDYTITRVCAALIPHR
jgi:hypothetical protein